jgi:integrase
LCRGDRLAVAETFTTAGTAGLARMIERAAEAAGLELKAHPHMLRHACGYALANLRPVMRSAKETSLEAHFVLQPA